MGAAMNGPSFEELLSFVGGEAQVSTADGTTRTEKVAKIVIDASGARFIFESGTVGHIRPNEVWKVADEVPASPPPPEPAWIAAESPQYRHRTREDLILTAAGFNCTAVFARRNELLLDIDEFVGAEYPVEAWRNKNQLKLELLGKELGGIRISETWASRNGGLHIRLQLEEEQSVPFLIALQLILGSDWKRELFALGEHLEHPEVDTRALFRPMSHGTA
jgi:hypothetical protein